MNFKDWHLQESIEISPEITSFDLVTTSDYGVVKSGNVEELKKFINIAFRNYLGKDFSNFINRYEIILKKINYHHETEFEFHLKPLGIDTPQKIDPSDDLYDYYQKHRGGLTGKYFHKTPKDAIKEIPVDPNLVYRGMSWEEWQFIRKNGFIQSKGSYNLGSVQDNLTFYGSAETAEHYANGFAPMAFMTSIKKPSVVIAISRKNVKSNKDMPDAIPGSEFAHVRKLSSKEIVNAWMLSPISSRIGKLSLMFKYLPKQDDLGKYTFELSPKPKEGSRMSPSVSYALRQLV